jgi:TonB family protein
MKTLVRYCTTCLLVMAVFALSSQEAVSQERLKTPYLTGIVGDFVTRAWIAGASVLIEETGAHAVSDDRGLFQIEGLAPGSYTIRIVHPNHRPLLYKNFQLINGGVHSFFVMKSGKAGDQPLVLDGTPRGQFVIDEDAEMIERREPVYPESALKEKAEGTVMLWVGVNEEGEVSSALPKEGSKRKDLIEASLDAVQYFKFKPAKVKGKPVEVLVTVPFNFKLADKSTNYPLQHLEGPLTADDVTQAFAYLGIQIERFAYDLPYKHKIKFWLDQYLDGKLADSKSYPIRQDPGKSSILVLKHQIGDSIRYTINLSSGNSRRIVSFGNIARRGYNSSGTQRMTDIVLRSDTKAPIYVYLSSPEGLSFKADDPLDQIIAHIKSVIVISAELQLE